MRVLCVVGARPNFVKIAAFLLEARKHPAVQVHLVHTGQHYDVEMSDSFFRDLQIPRPHANLGVGDGNSGEAISAMIRRLQPILLRERPDAVLVVGDVNSTLAGALAAAQLGIPVAHVEAGLRSFDLSMPEEINRIGTDAVSALLFASEPSALRNLALEGRPRERMFLVGNIMIDTLRRFLPVARCSTTLRDLGLEGEGAFNRKRRYAVLTLHRPSTVDDPRLLRQIWEVLNDIGSRIPIIFPVHPRTRKRFQESGLVNLAARDSGAGCCGIRIVPPLSYLQFLHLQSEATCVITDSGGIQEETTALGVPCLTLRENTERPATVSHGTNSVIGLEPERLRRDVEQILAGNGKRGCLPPGWDGRCAGRILRILCEYLGARGARRPEPLRYTRQPDVRSAHKRPAC
jgi:UDP-N-acetylglucosamine 2-epimerase (non-hydrolysing)